MGRQARGLQRSGAHAKCAGPRIMRGTTRTHAKCAGPRKVRGLRHECGDAKKCVGRGSIARAALSARAAIAWRVEWAALPTHLPRTCHSMPTQCNCCSTRVGRDEPQSPGTLRVNVHEYFQNSILDFYQFYSHTYNIYSTLSNLSSKSQHTTYKSVSKLQ